MKAHDQMMDGVTAHVASAATIFLSFGHVLPSVATLLAIAWYGTQLWDYSKQHKERRHEKRRKEPPHI